MFRKYVEIYNTLNLEKFFAAKEILASNSIQYKDTSVNNQLRLALNNIRGDNYLLSRDGTVKTNYRLSVEKKMMSKRLDCFSIMFKGHTGIARLCFALSGNRTRSPHFKR